MFSYVVGIPLIIGTPAGVCAPIGPLFYYGKIEKGCMATNFL